MSEHGHKRKANRRRRQKQTLEIEACSITLPLRITSEVVHHLAPGSPKPTAEPPTAITVKPGIAEACKKKEEKEKQSKSKKKEEEQKKRRSKKRRSKNKSLLQKEKASSAIPSLTCLRDEQKFAPGESTNPAKPLNLARPSKQLPSFN